ncbi:hypothetical protein DM02DRAFT_434944 [Periconia macrospinosa]|uniref:DEUBAD domain-containing protein n=1 Tax=Periconia macrospinosa TaxID=97972 RepID=A0A2V1DN83_9PLEO|nr:hypothetical protein DM02DRAFT_434944 [Periconia macrospinosa]
MLPSPDMALPVRSPPPSHDLLSDFQPLSSTTSINPAKKDPSRPHPHILSQAHSESRDERIQTAPKTPTAMGHFPGPMPGEYPSSSPLSSLGSSIDTPPHESSDTPSTPPAAAFDEPPKPSNQPIPSANINGNGKSNGKKRSLASPSPSPGLQAPQEQQQQSTRAKKQKQKKQTPTPPVSSRPTRVRKPPARLIDTPTTTAPKATRARTPPRKPKSKVWDPDYVTTNPKSRLTKTDLHHLLLEPKAWTCLTPSQHERIMALLPPSYSSARQLQNDNSTPIPRPSIFTLNSNLFRTDVAKFQEELREGHLTKTWQTSAVEAVIERAEGGFDKWKAEESERWWGQNA